MQNSHRSIEEGGMISKTLFWDSSKHVMYLIFTNERK